MVFVLQTWHICQYNTTSFSYFYFVLTSKLGPVQMVQFSSKKFLSQCTMHSIDCNELKRTHYYQTKTKSVVIHQKCIQTKQNQTIQNFTMQVTRESQSCLIIDSYLQKTKLTRANTTQIIIDFNNGVTAKSLDQGRVHLFGLPCEIRNVTWLRPGSFIQVTGEIRNVTRCHFTWSPEQMNPA